MECYRLQNSLIKAWVTTKVSFSQGMGVHLRGQPPPPLDCVLTNTGLIYYYVIAK